MEECSFCEDKTERDSNGKLPEGWGKAKLDIPGVEPVDVTFCPLHRAEAEEKLDLAFAHCQKH